MNQDTLLVSDMVMKLRGDTLRYHNMARVQLGVAQKYLNEYYDKESQEVPLQPRAVTKLHRE